MTRCGDQGRRPASLAVAALSILVLACPARRGGQTNGPTSAESEPAEPDAQATDAGLDASPDAAPPDAAPPDAGAPAADPADLTSGPVLGRAALPDGGPELRVEQVDAGYAFRLAAPGESGVEVEPIGRLEGPSPAGVFLGCGCQGTAPGTSRVLGIWSGERAQCATSLTPMAVMEGRPRRRGCATAPVEPGQYRLELYPCGRYSEPLFQVGFEVGEGEGEGEAP